MNTPNVRQTITKIKRRRKALRLSLSELATISGVSRNTIHNSENGKTIPRLTTITKLDQGIKKATYREEGGFHPAFIRPRRMAIRLSLQGLADRAGLGLSTVVKAEARHKCRKNTLESILNTLDQAEAEQQDRLDFRKARLERGIPIYLLAQRAGVSKDAIRQTENNRKSFPTTLVKIKAALNSFEALTGQDAKARRLALRLTIEELSRKAHISRRRLWEFENGGRLRLDILQKLMATLKQEEEARPPLRLSSGKEIREVRENLGISLRELARRIGINEATLCSIEKGRKKPRLKTIGMAERILADWPAPAHKTRRLYPTQLKSNSTRAPRGESAATNGQAAPTSQTAEGKAKGGRPKENQHIEEFLKDKLNQKPKDLLKLCRNQFPDEIITKSRLRKILYILRNQ